MIVIRSYGLKISVKFGYYVSAKIVLEAMKLKRGGAKIASGRGIIQRNNKKKVFYILQFIPKSCIFFYSKIISEKAFF